MRHKAMKYYIAHMLLHENTTLREAPHLRHMNDSIVDEYVDLMINRIEKNN